MGGDAVLPERLLSKAIPPLAPVSVTYPRPRVEDVRAAVRQALEPLAARLAVGKILITAGSRGVAQIDAILEEAVACVRRAGGTPQIGAAMGSHGGGAARGQRELLRHLGVTEERLGAPMLAADGARRIGESPGGRPLYTHPAALEADGILLINRIKPHTSFRGPWESGLVKMLVVGLGLKEGASTFHGYGPARAVEVLADLGPALLNRLPVVGGLAILENAYKEVAAVHGLPAPALLQREEELLREARRLTPLLPIAEVDLLIVDEMGKDISGTGMDTQVVGRLDIPGLPEPASPNIQRIVVLGLTPASHGNATGIGLADVVTRRLVAAMDPRATYLNAFTSRILNRVKVPLTAASDREAIRVGLATLPRAPGGDGPDAGPRLVRIRNTLALSTIGVSPALDPVVAAHPEMERCGPFAPLVFDAAGNLSANIGP